MHYWDDDWPHWDDLGAAITYFDRLVRRYRLRTHQIKEKFGTLRCYMAGLGFESLHDVTHPGYAYSRYPRWLWRMCCGGCLSTSNWFWKWLVWRPSSWVQARLYRRAYQKTLRRWPHLAPELLGSADIPSLLVGLVDPDECGHKVVWRSNKGERCGVCMKELEVEE
jgi:hypothetical protein